MDIIAGHIDPDGSIISGEGFDSFQEGQGRYHIIYHTPFADKPAVVATAGTGRSSGTNVNVTVNGHPHEVIIFSQDAQQGFEVDTNIHFAAIGNFR